MMFVKMRTRMCGICIDHAQLALKNHQRNAQHRTDVGSDHTLRGGKSLIGKNIVPHHRDTLSQYLACNGPADPERLAEIRVPLPVSSGNEIRGIVAHQKNRASLDRHDFENHLENPRFQILRIPNPANGRADSKQGGQIARHSPAWRHRLRDLVWLQKNRLVLFEFHRDRRDEMLFGTVGE